MTKGAKLKLGTLYSYRNIENAEVRDEHEGTYRFELNLLGDVAVEKQLAQELFQGIVDLGVAIPNLGLGFHACVDRYQLVGQTATSFILRDTRMRLTRSVPDSLIFCMSIVEDGTAPESPFSSATDWWGINFSLAQNFCNTVADKIFRETDLSFFDGDFDSSLKPCDVDRLKVRIRGEQVRYQDRLLIADEAGLVTYNQVIQLSQYIQFVKPLRFQREKEYRFVFDLYDEETGEIFPPKGPVFLDMNASK